MRPKVIILFCLLAAAAPVLADEKLPLLKAGGDVYSNVTVLSVSTTDVFFTYAHGSGVGMANAKLKDLDPALQKHFHYNATNAVVAEKKQVQANAQYHNWLAGQPVSQPPDESRERPAAAARAPEVLWRTDLPGALSQARSENKLVLLDFTGSDWCPWCIKFDQDVLSTSQFAAYASARLVLVKLDFPRHTPQSNDLKRANEELSNHFRVDGFPTYVLLTAAGQELGRQVGYLEGGPNAFIAELDNFSRR